MLNRGQTKDFKTYAEQVQILLSRGLNISDPVYAEQILRQTNYYRLSAYSLSLRHNDKFKNGVSFENIYELYIADAAFRRIIMHYCFCVEIAFRSYLAYYIGEHFGPLGYMDDTNFDNSNYHASFMKDLDECVRRSDDVFIEHHKRNLNSVFPVWVIVEVMTFGTISKLFKNMHSGDRTAISKTYIGYGRKYVENWLQCCAYCRNVAAHGGRFYNRFLRANPVRISAKDYPGVNNMTAFAFIIAIYNLLPSRDYKTALVGELDELFSKYSSVILSKYGFPIDWKSMMK